jgi:hypothetical protein
MWGNSCKYHGKKGMIVMTVKTIETLAQALPVEFWKFLQRGDSACGFSMLATWDRTQLTTD